jgi:hypothetical protein
MRDDRARAVWEVELDRLEVDVIRVERLVRSLDALPLEPWNPPPVPGQMPADLALRAEDLLDRQERAIAELRGALTEAQRQLAYADRVSDAVGPSAARPVYLDLEA